MAAATLVAVKSVLVADDTEVVRERFRAALETAGHRAAIARTGPELLSALRQQRPAFDLVVLDLRLPEGSGVDMLRALRRDDAPPAAVVVFSGTIASADEVRALAALGVAGYVNEYMSVQHIVPALAPYLFPNPANRRTGPRVALGVPIAYRYGNTIATSLTLNVGHGGLAVRTTSPLAPGELVRTRFRLPTGRKDVEAEARVVWADRRIGMGLRFSAIDTASQRAIDEFIQSHLI